MRREPDRAAPSRRLLTAVIHRRVVKHASYAIAAGAAVAGGWGLGAGDWGLGTGDWGLGAGAAVAGAIWWGTRRGRTRAAAAAAGEAAQPQFRNLLITAEEIERHPERALPAIAARVFAEADRVASDVRAADVASLRPAWLALGAVAAVAMLWTPPARRAMTEVITRTDQAIRSGGGGSITVTIDPPGYSGGSPQTLTDPERIDALAGSRIRVAVPAGWRVRLGDAPVEEFVARDSGYFAIEDAGGLVTALIPVTVTPDRSPAVRVEAPAKDLLLPDGQGTIPVSIRASDDLALSALELRYTRVSGSGEQFEFVEGSLPVALDRASAREWTARGSLALADLKLGPGDSLVYRAVARDRRPGEAGVASSDTYYVEIAGPGQIALEGVDMPPGLERYAMSQQMIVVKLERLKARESSLAREALVEETASIAAEQRTVRANFIFLLGGHVEDEEEEAEQSHEIQEGRLENTARRDIDAAISHMTRAERGMTAVDLAAALPPARAAVESLQRAFGRSRYLLRALATRSRLDPARRLTGALDDAADWRRTAPDAEAREGEAVRRLLGEIVRAVPVARAGALPEARRRALAERALAIDPASPAWQQVARRLTGAADPRALDAIAAEVATLALRGMAAPSAIERGPSPLVRAYRSERRP